MLRNHPPGYGSTDFVNEVCFTDKSSINQVFVFLSIVLYYIYWYLIYENVIFESLTIKYYRQAQLTCELVSKQHNHQHDGMNVYVLMTTFAKKDFQII